MHDNCKDYFGEGDILLQDFSYKKEREDVVTCYFLQGCKLFQTIVIKQKRCLYYLGKFIFAY